MDWNTIIVSGIMYLFGLVLGFFIGKSKYQIGRMIMTADQKKAIMVLMNLYNEEHIDEEQYFLLLNCVIDNKRHFNGLTEEQWEDYFKNRDRTILAQCALPNGVCTNPFHDCIGCPRQFGSWSGTTTANKIEEKQ